MIKQEMEMKQQQANNARRQMFMGVFQPNREGQQGQPGQPGQPGRGGQQGQPGAAGGRPGAGQDNNNDRDAENNDRRRGRPQIDPETQAKLDALEAQSESYEKEALQKIGKVLSASQIKQYNRLLGSKFDFSTLDLRTAGRGGFGGFGGFGGDRGGRGGRGGR
jgi:hypothetical protein